jgi:hypothetical protein
MDLDKEYIIPFSRKKILSSIRGNIFLIALLSFFFWQSRSDPTENSVLLEVVPLALILLFLVILISSWRRLSDKSPGLIISPKGVVENSSLFPVGLVIWKDVVGMYVKQYRSARWLMIEVCNPADYLSRDKLFVRMFRRLNSLYGGTPIFISAGLVDIDFDEMVSLIGMYCEKYGSA